MLTLRRGLDVNKKLKIIIFTLLALIFLTVAYGYFKRVNVPVLEPRGTIGEQQRNLILFALGLSLIVVIPVYVMLFSFAWRYREGNKKRAKYSPELAGSRLAEAIWWLIPGILITILSVAAWNSSHALDPYRPLNSSAKPLKIQVVALQWKWLFIYPDQHVASVNWFEFPVNTPLNFEVTADAPMNSFWIPQLGGQIYAMPGMSTQLHLAADKVGDYHGSSANISGDGFARMTFTARADSQAAFGAWVKRAGHSPERLNWAAYQALAKPGISPVVYYSSPQTDLYDLIVMKYVVPSTPNGPGYKVLPVPGMGAM